MTLWKNLVVALVAAFALAACSSSNDNGGSTSDETPPAQSGPTQAELDAEKARADAAEEALSDKEADEAAEQLTKTAAKLKAALGATPLAYNARPTTTVDVTPLNSSGLVLLIDKDQDDTTTADTDTPRMATGESAGALGDWAGTNYAHTNAAGVSNSALVYTNQASVETYPILARYVVETNRPANVPAGVAGYNPATRTVDMGTAADLNIKSDMFPTAGQTDFSPVSPSSEVLIPGTYQGAAGNYRCTGATCTATASAGGITLSENWMFIHDEGATVEVSVMDANYLYFGWWLRKDNDDLPTMASAFTGVQGTIADLTANPSGLGGSATYTGHAAGKFAVSDPLGDDDAGHFTADATFKAVFAASAAGGGLSGTLDNFITNDDDEVPWSVTLLRMGWNGTAPFPVNQGIDDLATPVAEIDESETRTVWSIDGNDSAASGTWSAQMYDEAPGAVAAGGDGSNVPTSLTGTFQSQFGSDRSMVGAFGATRDE